MVELQVTSNFSFLMGASHPEELVQEAANLGYKAIALTDLNSLAGIVRAHVAAKQAGIRFIVGSKLRLFKNFESTQSVSILCYPINRDSYGRLCKILSIGKRRAIKGQCLLTIEDFLSESKDLLCILIPPLRHCEPRDDSRVVKQSPPHTCHCEALSEAKRMTKPWQSPSYQESFFYNTALLFRESIPSEHLFLSITRNYDNVSTHEIQKLKELSIKLNIPLVATNDIYYHSAQRRPLQDVLSCIRNKCTIQEAGFKLFKNAERFLKPVSEIMRLFRNEIEAVRRTLLIEEKTSGFSLDLLKYEYPDEICPEGKGPFEYLKELTFKGALARYPQGISQKVKDLLEQEFALISELHYEKYFLTCHDIVRFARSQGILCQGRGAAANSAVCFCLGITSVDPEKIDILFARFVSKERDEPPDIDIDFEHERREEVIQYIYSKYGRHRAGLTAEVITYRKRSAIRDVGKALGLSLEIVDKLAKSIHRWTKCQIDENYLKELGLNPLDLTIRNTLKLTDELRGFPRHLSQHVGGFIISLLPLSETVPILNASMPNRSIIEWDKDDIEVLGMLKIDILALGMLSCIRKALEYINKQRAADNSEALFLHTIPTEDPKVYDMLCKADTIGVFQVESRAQMSMLPRLKPRCFYDLVIEVAIVRPGPIQGNMVHPYLKRRAGLEKVKFPDARVEGILGKTLGVPIFQEQAMRLSIVLAQFSPGEAEQLRRAMVAWKKNKTVIATFRERIVKGMLNNGYTEEFAETCVNQIKGFSEYGFPESHAASFALFVYASAWIKRYYPVEFAAALINSQPMGFYEPAQIVKDLEEHGGKVLPIDINQSSWDCSIEEHNDENVYGRKTYALRLGMRLIKGMQASQALLISSLRETHGKISSIRELWLRASTNVPVCLRTQVSAAPLRKVSLFQLAKADAFSSIGLSRREAIWEIKALPEIAVPLDKFESNVRQTHSFLSTRPLQEEMFQDYEMTGLSLKAHPISFIRELLNSKGVIPAVKLRSRNSGPKVKGAGLVIVRQRPGTAKGVVFISLEDETGIFNLIIRPHIFEKYVNTVISSISLLATGKLEKIEDIAYINVEELMSLDGVLLKPNELNLPTKSYSY